MKSFLLINPPLWYYQSIPPDIINISNILEKKNIDYDIRDLNLEALSYFISPDIINKLVDNNLFFEPSVLEHIYNEIENTYREITDIYPNIEFNINSYLPGSGVNSFSDIENIIDNKEFNPYIEFYRDILKDIKLDKYCSICISLFHPDQIIPLFSLCKMIKTINHNIYIVVHGNLEDQINTDILFNNLDDNIKKQINIYIDSIVFGNLSEKFEDLLEIISSDSSIKREEYELINKQSCYYIDDENGSKFNFSLNKDIMTKLPKSNFMPEDIINIISSVGCYWSKCSFCSIKEHWKYEPMNYDNIIDNFKVISKYGKNIIRFRDCCLHPNQLKEISLRILKNKMDNKWCCRARFEDGFDDDLIELISQAGCIMISFGVESFVPRINKLMNKGIQLSNINHIVKTCYKNGIAVKLTAIACFPTETLEEAKENINKLLDIQDYCVDIKLNKFILFKDSYIASHPSEYNLRITDSECKGNISIYKNYIDLNIESDNTEDFYNKYLEGVQLRTSFISEEHMLLYLNRYGLKKCMQFIKSYRNEESINQNRKG